MTTPVRTCAGKRRRRDDATNSNARARTSPAICDSSHLSCRAATPRLHYLAAVETNSVEAPAAGGRYSPAHLPLSSFRGDRRIRCSWDTATSPSHRGRCRGLPQQGRRAATNLRRARRPRCIAGGPAGVGAVLDEVSAAHPALAPEREGPPSTSSGSSATSSRSRDRLRVVQLLLPVDGAALGREIEQVEQRLDRADVPGILAWIGWGVEELRSPEVADHAAVAVEHVQHRL
jgi:hypothetical protein